MSYVINRLPYLGTEHSFDFTFFLDSGSLPVAVADLDLGFSLIQTS